MDGEYVEVVTNTTATFNGPAKTLRIGYIGSRCPNGDSIHVHPVTLQTSVPVTAARCGWPADTPTEPCPYC